MTGRQLFSVFATMVVVLALAAPPAAAVEPHAGMLRYPDVSSTHIAFRYANDLWLVPREGGVAVPLASPPGGESFPRFSPDGKTIAFMGNYDGNYDIYTLPVSGGTPFRVTHHPTQEVLTEWTSDGRLIFYCFGMGKYPRSSELWTVSAAGGLPEKMPVPYGANATISPDGDWLAYTPHSRDHRTWKRYRGGMATNIWLFNLKNQEFRAITDWEGTDSQPMWHGDKLFYLSDAGPNHRLNIWVYNFQTDSNRQVTKFKDYDVKWPAVGPGPDGEGEIVFQMGPELHLLNLRSEKSEAIKVTIPGDRPKIRVQATDVSDLIFVRNISPNGKRVVVGARGDIWTLPAKKGSPMNLTRTSGVAERNPSWSPDGKWIAYFSDKTGGYGLYLTQSDGNGETKKLVTFETGFLYTPRWSPDSKWICINDQTGTIFLVNAKTGNTRTVDRNMDWGSWSPISWSHDSNWIAYHKAGSMLDRNTVWLYSVDKDKKYQVTSGMFNDTWPVFDREGKYLYFASQREFSEPIYEDLGTTWVYAKTDRIYCVPLKSDTPSPLAPKSDDEEWDDEDKDENGKKDEDKKDDEEEEEEKKVEIDIDGFEHRMVLLPAGRGNFGSLFVNDSGNIVYTNYPGRGFERNPEIRLIDFSEDEESDMEKTVLSGASPRGVTKDGSKILVATREGSMAIIDAKADQKMKDMVSTAGMVTEIDPREEWKQLLTDAWRIQRDFFYVDNMHGVDWKAVYRQYADMLDDCACREDVSFLIREMISELNIGHTYYFGGDTEQAPSVSVGMLGCDFEMDDGAYRISKIYEGAPWDADARGPLSQPAVDVKEGNYFLAVNGVEVDAGKDPWAALQGLAGSTIRITVSDKPKIDDDARHVLVEALNSERNLRYRDWVEANRAYVEEKTDGRVGYVYVPNTGINGQDELVRQYFCQLQKDAMIIDERWNGGGQVPYRFIELMNRPLASYFALRYSEEGFPWPPDAHQGPKCMLINGLAGSGGDYFPFWFKGAGVGKLIGMRTWGGLVGMSGNPQLIDGGYTSVPTFGHYEKDGQWAIEGHGVDPDIEVFDDPSKMYGGRDIQLDAAIEHMLEELKTNAYKAVRPPEPPDRSGMGIKPEHR
jgi:tricorn protease